MQSRSSDSPSREFAKSFSCKSCSMSSEGREFKRFYEDQITVHQLPYARDRVWDRWKEPSVILSATAIVITLLIKAYGFRGTLGSLLKAVTAAFGDLFVFAMPGPLLFSLDEQFYPTSPSRGKLDGTRRSTHAAKREAVGRLIDFSRPGGLLWPLSKASMAKSVSASGADAPKPPGLGNRDNSCYQNSILQGLASLESFLDYLLVCERAGKPSNADEDVVWTLRGLLRELNDSTNNGTILWTPRLLKSMNTWMQQDAQEYFSKLLDDIDQNVTRGITTARRFSGLEADCSKHKSFDSKCSDDSGYQSLHWPVDLTAFQPLRNPLEGWLAQRVACVQCGFSEGLSMIPFNCLTLSLGLDKHQHDLYERLEAYSRVESIVGVDCAKCTLRKAQKLLARLVANMQDGDAKPEELTEPRRRLAAVETALEEDDFTDTTMKERCKISNQGKVSSTKTKQIVIARPPQSLAVHINRSVFDPMTCDMIKNSAPVSFPLVLDLGPWCLGSSEKPDYGAAMRDAGKACSNGAEQWPMDPKASMVAGDLKPSRLTGPIYELRAVVTHTGRHENGHYICYRRYHSPRASQSDSADEWTVRTGNGENATEPPTETRSKDVGAGWWRFSDHNVSEVDEQTVLGLSPGVFMLLYECVDQSMVLRSELETMTKLDGFGTERDESWSPRIGDAAGTGAAVGEAMTDDDKVPLSAHDDDNERLGDKLLDGRAVL